MADATATTTPKIEELRARLKAEPKSRHFYPLAEELRKHHQFEQAEEILREGLQHHPGYLSAWISLGRVLRDRAKDHEAVEVLKRALALDGGNVVAAKLLAQAYLGVGDKVDAIKKFKLVFALMPADAEVEAEIERLDRELNPHKYAPAVEESPAAGPAIQPATSSEIASGSLEALPEAGRFDLTDSHPFSVDEEPFVATSEAALSNLLEPSAADESAAPAAEAAAGPESVDESPFPADVLPASLDSAEPEPFEPASLVDEGVLKADVFEGSGEQDSEESGAVPPAPIPATLTMAQLYEAQGHVDQERALYGEIVQHEPANEEARAGLIRLGEGEPRVTASLRTEKVRRLESWRARVARS